MQSGLPTYQQGGGDSAFDLFRRKAAPNFDVRGFFSSLIKVELEKPTPLASDIASIRQMVF
jgi:hypothetical protein